MNVLVIAAHPDDEVLGAGGTIAASADAGHEVRIGILGEGATSRGGVDDGAVEVLREQARRAAGILGAREVLFAGLPDNRFDTVALLDIVKIVEGWIDRCEPATVYTHSGGDVNIDHALTFRAVLTATRPVPGSAVRELYSFEIASSTEWAFQSLPEPFKPTTFVDVTGSVDRKVQALEAYTGETRPFPHPRSTENVTAMARHRGATAGLQFAEAFQLIRSVQTIR